MENKEYYPCTECRYFMACEPPKMTFHTKEYPCPGFTKNEDETQGE